MKKDRFEYCHLKETFFGAILGQWERRVILTHGSFEPKRFNWRTKHGAALETSDLFFWSHFGRINSEWNLMGIDGDGGENGFGNWIAVGKLWKVTPNLIED